MRMPFPWRHLLAAALLSSASLFADVPASPAHASNDEISRVVELTNLERIKAGLKPLVANTSLNGASHNYSGVLATDQCFAHTCGPEPEFNRRAASAGYAGWTRLGENIAAGQRTPEEVVAAWMNSPGHRANILNPDFNEIGVGVVRSGKMGTYWTQMFGTRPNVTPPTEPPAVPAWPTGSRPPGSPAAAPAAGAERQSPPAGTSAEPVPTAQKDTPRHEAAAHADEHEVTLVNNTGGTLTELYVNPSSWEGWGENLLGGAVIASGNSVAVSFKGLAGEDCLCDILAIYDTGAEAELHYVDLCSIHSITFNDPGEQP